MKLIYRGIPYNEDRSVSIIPPIVDREIVYRGNSSKARINPKFPWWKYIKQLFQSESKSVLDPITFWYNHKREYIKDCWYLSNTEKLELVWDLTTQIEQAKALKPKQNKLKYRGVTYYH